MEGRSDTAMRRSSLLALVAFVIDLAIPLLPVYGNGHQTLFGIGFPIKIVLMQVLGFWASAIVVLVGIWLLARSRGAVAVGMLVAIAVESAIQVVSQAIITTDVFRHWQSVVVLGLTAAEAVLLLLAAASAWRAVAATHPRTPVETTLPTA
jgi:hypothetical protein